MRQRFISKIALEDIDQQVNGDSHSHDASKSLGSLAAESWKDAGGGGQKGYVNTSMQVRPDIRFVASQNQSEVAKIINSAPSSQVPACIYTYSYIKSSAPCYFLGIHLYLILSSACLSVPVLLLVEGGGTVN
jgi:hypothetical protein